MAKKYPYASDAWQSIMEQVIFDEINRLREGEKRLRRIINQNEKEIYRLRQTTMSFLAEGKLDD